MTVSQGTAFLDDVQIEAAASPTLFNVRPQEWLRLQIEDGDSRVLPKWVQSDRKARRVAVYNDSSQPLEGLITLFMGPWDHPAAQKLAQFPASELPRGHRRTITFTTDSLPPDAYVVTLRWEWGNEILVEGRKSFFPHQRAGGEASNGMLGSRTATRFLIAPQRPPEKIFGVGNGMLAVSDSFQEYPIDNYILAHDLGVTCSRGPYGDDVCYLTAVAGIPIHAMNPAIDTAIDYDVFHPDGLAYFKQRAEDLGRQFAANPVIASFQMANEQQIINKGRLIPSVWADANFRAWCQRRHSDLRTLNQRWRTHYTDWSQVEQIISARFLEEAKQQPQPQGAAAIDWTGSTGYLSDKVVQRMFDDPGRALDWLRWRTHSTLWMYNLFRTTAKRFDQKTLYSTNLCWPAFWPQMFMPFIRDMDVTMLDIQYTSGLARSLGTPYEMLDSLEMAESVDPAKPIWGCEIYYQPQWPAKFVPFQNWGLVAHGMTNILQFAWTPFSDHTATQVPKPRWWEDEDAVPMWFIIDTDGTRLPGFYTYKQSLREIQRYHRRFDGLSIKRAATDIALYVSPDTAEYVTMETGNKPWGSYWQRTRNNLIYLLRMSGITVDYVDDATLPGRPGKYRKIIVPATYLLSQEAAGKLADFTRSGGTLILAGPCGLRDPWYKPYQNVGGPAWQQLDWQAPAY